jgi:3-methyladenine DNA glycosylase/8-oxoguanine DNA glycosylase
MPRLTGRDGLYRWRGGVLHRLTHVEGDPVHLRVTQLTGGEVLFGACAPTAAQARAAIAAMRRALGVDLDLRPFLARFRNDPLIGPAVRADPAVRITGRPEPFEALWLAVCEQLIEYERAARIERRIVRALGRHDPVSDLQDGPTPAALAAAGTPRLASLDLAAGRARSLIHAAREVAAGRVRLDPASDAHEQEANWRRLARIPGIGAWTVEMLAVFGQGRLDRLPAGDLGYLKYVGRRLSGGDPYARATVEQVRELFAPYGEWQALAGAYALRLH